MGYTSKELLALNNKDLMNLVKKEINEINEIENIVFEDDKDDYDYDFFEYTKHIKRKNLNEIIKEHQTKRINDIFGNEKIVSKVFKFKLNKIMSFNELYYKVDKKAHYTSEYNKYRDEIKSQITDELRLFLNYKNVEMSISFFIKNINKDLDNLENVMEQVFKANYKKAFIDSIYDESDLTDNVIKKIKSEIYKAEDEEFILIKFETLTDYEIERSELLAEYNKQKN